MSRTKGDMPIGGLTRVPGRIAVLLVAVTGLVLSIVAADAVYSGVVDRGSAAVERRSDDIASVIGHELNSLVTSGRGVAALVGSNPELDQDEYERGVDAILGPGGAPSVAGFNIVEWVPEDDRSAFVERTRSKIPGFWVRPSGDGDAAVLTLVHPIEANRTAIGFDVTTNPLARPALDRARVAGVPSMTDPLRIVQETGDQVSVVVYVPITDDDGSFFGWVSGVVRGQQFLDQLDLSPGGLSVRVVDPDDPSSVIGRLGPEPSPAGEPAVVRTITTNGQRWQVEFWQKGSSALGGLPLFLIIFAIGMAIVALTTALVWQMVRREAVALEMVEQRTADLRAVNDDLMAANRVKDDFLAVVSHEFRTPLTIIKGSAEMLGEDDLPAHIAFDLIERIGSNADRLSSLVGDLLVAARLEAGKLRVLPQQIELAGALDTVVRELGPMASGVVDHLEPGTVVTADPFHLDRILSNLLSNAYKYGRPPVVVSSEWRSDRWAISVRDHGPGVPPGMESRLFGAFEQGDSGTHRRSIGVGLGLNIVQRLVRLNGGEIVYRRGSPGSVFTLTLPGSHVTVIPTTEQEVASSP